MTRSEPIVNTKHVVVYTYSVFFPIEKLYFGRSEIHRRALYSGLKRNGLWTTNPNGGNNNIIIPWVKFLHKGDSLVTHMTFGFAKEYANQ